MQAEPAETPAPVRDAPDGSAASHTGRKVLAAIVGAVTDAAGSAPANTNRDRNSGVASSPKSHSRESPDAGRNSRCIGRLDTARAQVVRPTHPASPNC